MKTVAELMFLQREFPDGEYSTLWNQTHLNLTGKGALHGMCPCHLGPGLFSLSVNECLLLEDKELNQNLVFVLGRLWLPHLWGTFGRWGRQARNALRIISYRYSTGSLVH